MDEGPLFSAMQQQASLSFDTGAADGMSTDEMRQLLILMGTITVISFVLVVSVVTILIAFIWYTRRRLNNIDCCSCSKGRTHQLVESGRAGLLVEAGHRGHTGPLIQSGQLHEKTIVSPYLNNCMLLQPKSQLRGLTPAPCTGSSAAAVTGGVVGPVMGGGSHPPLGVSLGAPRLVPVRTPAGQQCNSVIVNPLPPSNKIGSNSFGSNGFLPGSKTSNFGPVIYGGRHTKSSIGQHPADDLEMPRSDYSAGEVEEEPIYQEIKLHNEKDDHGPVGNIQPQTTMAEHTGKLTSSSAATNAESAVAATGHNPTTTKKEIEYWQITAKEVVKFRPCTETFINRI